MYISFLAAFTALKSEHECRFTNSVENVSLLNPLEEDARGP